MEKIPWFVCILIVFGISFVINTILAIVEQKKKFSDYRCLSWHVISVPGTFLLWYFINAWAFLYVKYPSWASYIDYNNKNLLHGKGKRTRKRMVREKAYGKLLGNTIEELGGE